MVATSLPLRDLLARRTREGDLYERLPGQRVRCFACGHRCLIPPGQDGICRVRFNDKGALRVPHGYVAALQVDPVEKKPFFHALPGSRALSFGMLGCDYHCGYCFTGDTTVLTDSGPMTFEQVFEDCERHATTRDAELAFPSARTTVTASGAWATVLGVARHRYRGALVSIKPCYLPAIRCTPDHRVYATSDASDGPRPFRAADLRDGDWVVIPRPRMAGASTAIDVATLLSSRAVVHRVSRAIPVGVREQVLLASARGETSRSIGTRLGLAPSHVRHLRSRARRGLDAERRVGRARVEGDRVRFPKERAPGIPASVPLDESMAALLGYYCAEGCVVTSRSRPNSHVLNFSFGPHEERLVDRVRALLSACLDVESRLVRRRTTLAVACGKSSAAVLFESLCGRGSRQKHVPRELLHAPVPILRAFLAACVEGDGHRYDNGKVSLTTVSKRLAEELAWIVLRCGFLPSIYAAERSGIGRIAGRPVRQAPIQYAVVWRERPEGVRRVIERQDHYLVPIRAVSVEHFDGLVYNMEVEGEHSYLAGFLAVSNCQNWVTSQALRDPRATAPAQDVGPAELVRLARTHDARIMTSTYNEPLITSEWAIDVFKEARRAGLVCSYVSNGNGTPEVLDYIRPYVSLYKVDLKGFRDRSYRDLGGVLKHVQWTIGALVERGFWTEVVTLVVPGFNDSDAELREMAAFLAGVSRDIPWHVTAFHQDYKMTDPPNTTTAALVRAAEIGAAEGLRFVYAGNLPGRVGRWENTYCPSCGELLIERLGFRVLRDRIPDGTCPRCAVRIPGFWEPQARAVAAAAAG